MTIAINQSRNEGSITVKARNARSCGSFILVRTCQGFRVYHASFTGYFIAKTGAGFKDRVIAGLQRKGWSPIDARTHHDVRQLFRCYC